MFNALSVDELIALLALTSNKMSKENSSPRKYQFYNNAYIFKQTETHYRYEQSDPAYSIPSVPIEASIIPRKKIGQIRVQIGKIRKHKFLGIID